MPLFLNIQHLETNEEKKTGGIPKKRSRRRTRFFSYASTRNGWCGCCCVLFFLICCHAVRAAYYWKLVIHSELLCVQIHETNHGRVLNKQYNCWCQNNKKRKKTHTFSAQFGTIEFACYLFSLLIKKKISFPTHRHTLPNMNFGKNAFFSYSLSNIINNNIIINTSFFFVETRKRKRKTIWNSFIQTMVKSFVLWFRLSRGPRRRAKKFMWNKLLLLILGCLLKYNTFFGCFFFV